jgi:hypothetical protein
MFKHTVEIDDDFSEYSISSWLTPIKNINNYITLTKKWKKSIKQIIYNHYGNQFIIDLKLAHNNIRHNRNSFFGINIIIPNKIDATDAFLNDMKLFLKKQSDFDFKPNNK